MMFCLENYVMQIVFKSLYVWYSTYHLRCFNQAMISPSMLEINFHTRNLIPNRGDLKFIRVRPDWAKTHRRASEEFQKIFWGYPR
jgi:hypothetical protein